MELLNEQISKDVLKKYLNELYTYCLEKLIGIDRNPKIIFSEDQQNADDIFGKTGFYDPETEEIHLFVTDRHPKDILRSLAHELVHHEQNCRGDTEQLDMTKTAHDPAYASHDAGLREMERDAFERGNMIFRDWCDSKKIERTKIMENKTMKIKIKKGVEEVVNKDKADLNKDGKLSPYEKKRGDAIEKAMGVQEAHGDPEELDFSTLPKSHRKAGMTDFEMDPDANEPSHGHEEEAGEEEVEVSPFENAQSLAGQIKAALADGDREEARQLTRELLALLKGNPGIKLHHGGKEVKIKEAGAGFGEGPEGKEKLSEKKMQCETCGAMYEQYSKHSCEEGKKAMNESKENNGNPYPQLFQEKQRLFKERFNNHEEIVFQELMKRFINKEQK